jgi:polar amino acid transport system substrate-binding protein
MKPGCNIWAAWGLLLAAAAFARPASAAAELLVVTESMPVFQHMDHGQIAGSNTKVVRAIIAEAGLDAEFQIYPWVRAYKLALQRPDVLIYAIARTKDREELFHWIGPLADFRLAFIRLKSNSKAAVWQLSDARSLTIAVQQQDSTFQFLSAQGFTEAEQLMVVADTQQSWSLLAKAKVDLIVENPNLLPALVQETGLPADAFEVMYLIPELQLKAYVAASKSTKQSTVDKLRQAYQKVVAKPD